MFIYNYACHDDEQPLCRLELRILFGVEPAPGFVCSERDYSADRSPFFKKKLTVLRQSRPGDSLEAFAASLSDIELEGCTFKIVCAAADRCFTYDEQRAIERTVGAQIRGKADMRTPQRVFGIAKHRDSWLFGPHEESEPVWLRHQHKPRQYSTALNTRTARAVASMAAAVTGLARPRIIDPCCGIGTVLLEALSMGYPAAGADRNPLAVTGARENLAAFGYPDVVTLGDIRRLSGTYDAVIVDLPYNRCSVLPEEERYEMLGAARRLAGHAVIIATEPIGPELERAGFRIADSCELPKGAMVRHFFVAE